MRHRKLKCETDTPAMERRILRAFQQSPWIGPGDHALRSLKGSRYDAAFEHGQWFISDIRTGAQWSVVDAVPGIDGFDFELLTAGEEDY